MKGDGHLYLRGSTWWACLYRDGRRIRESLHTGDRDVAEKRLANLRRARERGAYLAPRERRVTINELLDDLMVHLELRGARSTKKYVSTLRPVRAELGELRASSLETARIERLQAEWLREGFKPATINRRCEALRQAYRLAARRAPAKVRAVPLIPALKVLNARQGFVSRAEYEAIRSHLEPDIQDWFDWFFWTGMRPNEIRQLTWAMYDRETSTLTLDPQAAKTGRGRVLAVTGPLEEILKRRMKARRLDCPLIFHRVSRHWGSYERAGSPIGRAAWHQWRAAVKAAGLRKGLVPYDLRRTALRNMIRAGTDFTVAMKISGHRSRSTFDRYNIVDETDVRKAVLATEAYLASRSATKPATKPRRGPRRD